MGITRDLADFSHRVSSSGSLGSAGSTMLSNGSAGSWQSQSFLRNRIINGTMDFWQRGTSGFGPGGYGADRWYLDGASATSSRNTDVPNSTFLYSNEWGYPGTASCSLRQRIEAANCRDLAGQTVTVSFWAKSISGTTALSYSLSYPTTTDNFSGVSEGNIASFVTIAATPSTSWTYYTFSVAVPAASTTGLQLSFNRNSGGSATTRITGVQLEVGTVATPFERRQYGQELSLCQRYYEVLGDHYYGATNGTGNVRFTHFYKVTKRATPTVTATLSPAGAVIQITVDAATTEQNSPSDGRVQASSMTFSSEL